MSIVAFIIGISITTALGWLILATTEGKNRVLSTAERISFAVILGPTVSMFIVFLCHIAGLTTFNLIGFVAPLLGAVLILTAAAWKRGGLRFSPDIRPFVPKKSHPRWMNIGVFMLCIWTAVKILAGAYDQVSVPTYWDDSFNNWNMRGKIFFVTEKLTLDIPAGNGLTTPADGVGSYPPMLPMMKTWLSVLRDSWSEPLVNGVHLVWFFGLLSALYLILRRSFDPLLSALGIWACVSLPLLLIHGSNPYADLFVAAHLLLAVGCLLGIRRASSANDVATWTKLFCLSLGLLALTKNESLVLHIPLLILAAVTFDIRRKNLVSAPEHRKTILIGLCLMLSCVLPWIFFKWTHGLTFGNAKSLSGFSIAFNSAVLKAIWIHLSHEPNWLLLPLVLPLTLMAAGKQFWKTPEAVLGAFVLAEIALQFTVFLSIPSLATEAINQTGLSRGLLHIAPLTILLLFFAGKSALATHQE